MFSWIKRFFSSAPATPAARPQDAPDYVPTPKPKDPNAMHPLVRAKMNQPPRATGFGVVYDREGRPKITEDWLKHLNANERRAVDHNLAEHGWKISADGGSVEKL